MLERKTVAAVRYVLPYHIGATFGADDLFPLVSSLFSSPDRILKTSLLRSIWSANNRAVVFIFHRPCALSGRNMIKCVIVIRSMLIYPWLRLSIPKALASLASLFTVCINKFHKAKNNLFIIQISQTLWKQKG